MFKHKQIQNYDFKDVPLDEDIFIMDEKWLPDLEQALKQMLEGGDFPLVGRVGYALAKSVSETSIEISWLANFNDRFHEVIVPLPRTQFVACLDCREYDIKPRLFVRSDWLQDLYLRTYSTFAMVDAIGVKASIANGTLNREKLIELRNRIDHIADEHNEACFVSFADSLLIKGNWSVGRYNSGIKYTYEPEKLLNLLIDIRSAYKEILGLSIYVIVAQGRNEYSGEGLLHTSPSGNHISLNSLGIPFSQIMSMDNAIHAAISNCEHKPAEIYMDESFYHSLKFDFRFKKNEEPKSQYMSPMLSSRPFYYYGSLDFFLSELETDA